MHTPGARLGREGLRRGACCAGYDSYPDPVEFGATYGGVCQVRSFMTDSCLSAVRVVLFDAVGTVLQPCPSAGDAYYAAGREAGSRLARDEVAARFRREFAREFGDERAEVATSEALERQRWRNVVARVFDEIADVDAQLFPRLWRHFGDSGNWRVFDDAGPVWQSLAAAGYRLGLASNFDARLIDVCRGFPFLADCPRVFVSSTLGWAKPARGFFRAIERQLACQTHEILLVGDDLDNDYHGARAAGWRARWLCRESNSVAAALPAGDVLGSLLELLGGLPARSLDTASHADEHQGPHLSPPIG